MVVLMLIGGLFFLALSVVGLLSAASSRRFRTAQRLSTIEEYGFSASGPTTITLGDDERTGGLGDLVTAIGEVVQRRIGTLSEAEVRSELMKAGMYSTSPGTILGYRVLAMLIVPVLAYVILGTSSMLRVAMIVIMIPWGWTLPLVMVRRRARLRLDEIDRRLPDLIDLLTVMVEAGMGFGAAMGLAAEKSHGPLADELRLTLQEQTMGLGLDTALGNMAN